MTHALGHVIPDGRTFTQAAALELTPAPGSLGGPRFVFLHFDSVALDDGARLEIDLGYDTDVFTSSSGSDFWSRPVSGATSPVIARILGGDGSARLLEYGSGEPTETANPPGTATGSRSNPDPFLITNPYQEPIYETRLECHPGFAWSNARCSLPTVPDAVHDCARAASGIIIEAHGFGGGDGGHVSSCSGTLIAGDLFLTARHCLVDPAGRDVQSASVTFDYETDCAGHRPPGHDPRFFKVVEEVAAGVPAGNSFNSTTDWVLLRLDGAPGELPAPVELRDSVPMAGETLFTMHHPNGSVKKTQEAVHGGGTSIMGFDFCGGSSGSALFDSSARVVGGPLSVGPLGNACTVLFTATAGIRAALGNPPPPPNPLDVMIVFDRSGSMSGSAPPAGRSKLEEAQDAASLFVQLVREGAGDRLGLVTFSSAAGIDRALDDAATVKPLLVGPPPFTGGQIGLIAAGGNTSIGAGLGIAQLGFGGGGGNDRAILLMTDGLQNTAPMVEEVEPHLGGTLLNVIGFGSDAQIDGPLLTRVAHEHGGHFTRALDGLGLRKFFGLSFGNIFESGALADPEFVLRKDEAEDVHRFRVCGEDQVTVILGWDAPASPLRARVYTPDGTLVTGGRRTREVRGRSWLFWRIPLPHAGERDGEWTLVVERDRKITVRARRGREAAASAPSEFATDVRYFYLVTAVGGPKLRYLGSPRHVYTGDVIHPRVGLHHRNGTVPSQAQVTLQLEAPTIALGQLAMEAGLHPPATSGDAVDGFHSTLQMIASQNGGILPVGLGHRSVTMFDDGLHQDGAMEPDGIYNHPLDDVARAEGTYTFRAVATYGEDCRATREVQWSVHVEPGIDPTRTGVTLDNVREVGGETRGQLVLTPRDRYDNPLGPGRPGAFTVAPIPGVRITGTVKDRGAGTYVVDVAWDPGKVQTPGVLVQQPDRDPVPVAPGKDEGTGCAPDCRTAAGALLDCLGLDDPRVERVRVKRVSVEIDLEDESCNPRCKGAERGKSGPPNNDADKGHRHRSGDGKDGDDCGC